MASPRWTESSEHRPVIVVSIEHPSTEELPPLESFINVAEKLLQRREPGVVVLDLTHARPDADRRRRVVGWGLQHREELERLLLGLAVVVPTRYHRGLLMAASWLQRPFFPLKAVVTVEEGIEWARSLIHEEERLEK